VKYTATVAGNDDEEEPEAIVVKAVPTNKRSIWIGYKDALDAIESYQIIVNGQSIYTQNYAIEESYITALATT
jgi:hypothetical protein